MPEFAITGSPIKLGPAANTSLVVRFYSKEVPLIRLAQRVGTATEWIDFVEIRHAGENLNCIDRPVRDEDKQRYAEQWQRYIEGREQTPSGTPIALLFKGSPGILKALSNENIHTLEQLSGLSAHAITSIGMGAQDWVNAATRYLKDASKGVDKAHFESEIKKLTDENGELRLQVDALKKAVDRLLLAIPERT
jgi:hypothetical protein